VVDHSALQRQRPECTGPPVRFEVRCARGIVHEDVELGLHHVGGHEECVPARERRHPKRYLQKEARHALGTSSDETGGLRRATRHPVQYDGSDWELWTAAELRGSPNRIPEKLVAGGGGGDTTP